MSDRKLIIIFCLLTFLPTTAQQSRPADPAWERENEQTNKVRDEWMSRKAQLGTNWTDWGAGDLERLFELAARQKFLFAWSTYQFTPEQQTRAKAYFEKLKADSIKHLADKREQIKADSAAIQNLNVSSSNFTLWRPFDARC